jgi:hypothetical protein
MIKKLHHRRAWQRKAAYLMEAEKERDKEGPRTGYTLQWHALSNLFPPT